MNALRSADWHDDLRASRDLSDWEKQHFGFVLAWFQSWRLREELPAGREAAVRFWREMVQCKPRKEWQTEGWAQGLAWYLRWLEMCAAEGRQVGSVAERMHGAVMRLGARRGLARSTRREYAGWVARFGEWVGSAREAMDQDKAGQWLAWLVAEKRIGFETQKKALNGIVFFLREVCGIEEVSLDVRLRKTPKREKVVLSVREVLALLDRLKGDYRLAGELQYGGARRLSHSRRAATPPDPPPVCVTGAISPRIPRPPHLVHDPVAHRKAVSRQQAPPRNQPPPQLPHALQDRPTRLPRPCRPP